MNEDCSQQPKHIEIGQSSAATVLTFLDPRINDDQQVTELKDELVSAVRQAPQPSFVVDMRHVEFISSIALMPLLVLRRTVAELGGQIVLCNLKEGVAKVLTLSQLIIETRSHAKQLMMADDMDSALRILGQGTA